MERHLREVSACAGEFASAFGAREWGQLAGLWHDLGKYSAEFQSSISNPDISEQDQMPGRVDHSTFGAQYSDRVYGGQTTGKLLAFCIAGHHAGLADGTAVDAVSAGSTLTARLARTSIPQVTLPPGFASEPPPKLRLPFSPSGKDTGFQIAFFTRMLFSCLVDADRLCTERFCDKEQHALRCQPKPTLSELETALQVHLHLTAKKAGDPATAVNQARRAVLADCLAAADLRPGFFSLNVPTGGGKSLSSLAFAFRHALAHDLRRVVVAIPFTSIIEQTAEVYRNAISSHGLCDEAALIEHHTNLDPRRSTRRHQLATENWDAPLIITTNVQLFESLFAAATTPCRKLHRLARSVIILDEAQTLPVELLAPTLAALKELVAHYGCTVVLCTATQPALGHQPGTFDIGLKDVRPIIRDEQSLFTMLKRVTVTRLGRVTDTDLVTRLTAEPSALCIVNTRPHAARLADMLRAQADPDTVFHLSTFMCAQHRREVLARVRSRLAGKLPTRIISTQLVEAGVDIDLPVVFRAAAGFDSVAQAAGRCNREGKLPAPGKVFVFDAETPPPPGLQRAAADVAAELAPAHPDPLTPAAIHAYFTHFYWHQSHHRWDKPGVLAHFDFDPRRREVTFKFRQAERDYQIIRDEQSPILVPYNDEAKSLIEALLSDRFNFATLRSAQKYTVSVRENLLRALLDSRAVVPHDPSGLWILANPSGYCPLQGLSTNAVGLDPNVLIY